MPILNLTHDRRGQRTGVSAVRVHEAQPDRAPGPVRRAERLALLIKERQQVVDHLLIFSQ